MQTGGLMREEEGRHTTTASRSYALASGGTLIDSPGVRDFAPAIDQLDARTLGFPEVERLARRLPILRLPPHAGAGLRRDQRDRIAARCRARRYESYRRLRRHMHSDLVEVHADPDHATRSERFVRTVRGASRSSRRR